MLRRQLLLGLGALATTAFTATPLRARASGQRDTLVFVFLRGGADGLNMVIPHGDNDYYAASKRGEYNVAIAAGEEVDLDGFFGLNPAMSGLKSIYDNTHLAIVHAAGVAGGNHSHFAMQDFIEFSTHASGDGWIKRYLETVMPRSPGAQLRAVALAGRSQKSLAGDFNALTADKLEDFSLDVGNDSAYKRTLDELLDSNHPFDLQGKQVLSVMQKVKDGESWTRGPQHGASYPQGTTGAEGAFVRRMAAAAQVLKTHTELEVLCLDYDGWDTHADQRNRMQGKLKVLGDTLKAFYTDMGALMGNVTVVVLSEFGRRILANNTKGTDHGLGGCLLVMGHGVNGGRVYARNWERKQNQLLSTAAGGMNNNGNLKVTTDYRAVLSELLFKRMGVSSQAERDYIFPGFGKPAAEPFQPLDLFLPG